MLRVDRRLRVRARRAHRRALEWQRTVLLHAVVSGWPFVIPRRHGVLNLLDCDRS
jgi:hypothetical protein